MGLYVYCVGWPDHPSPGGVRGLEGAPVSAREVAGLVAWVSELGEAPDPSLDAVREHNAVVEAAAQVATPLPLRFGQWFEGPDELESSLEARAAGLAVGLERVRDAQEFGVRVLDPASATVPPDRTSGRAYLESLARRDQEAEHARSRGVALAAELEEWLAGLVRDRRVRPLGEAGGLVAVAHLVDRHDTRRYDSRIREFPARYPALRFHFSGPWPPYGFVADE